MTLTQLEEWVAAAKKLAPDLLDKEILVESEDQDGCVFVNSLAEIRLALKPERFVIVAGLLTTV